MNHRLLFSVLFCSCFYLCHSGDDYSLSAAITEADSEENIFDDEITGGVTVVEWWKQKNWNLRMGSIKTRALEMIHADRNNLHEATPQIIYGDNNLQDDDSSEEGSAWQTYKTVWILMIIVPALMVLISFIFFKRLEKDLQKGEVEQKTWNVFQYLRFTQADDVDVNKSPLGGFNVTYKNNATDQPETNLATGEDARLTGRTSLSHPNGVVPLSSSPKEQSVTSRSSSNEDLDESSINDRKDATVSEHYNPHVSRDSRSTFFFFAFICVSVGIQCLEGGFVAAMMPNIQEDLGLSYTDEGTIAASPEYGLAPGAILAIWTFRHVRAKVVLQSVFCGLTLLSLVAATLPSMTSLVTVRALAGILWGHTVVFYPVWIDRHGPNEKKRTVWFGWMTVSILIGVLAGYIIGATARASGGQITWMDLYYVEAGLMAICGIVLWFGFDQELIRNDGPYRPIAVTDADGQAAGATFGEPEEGDDNDSDATVLELFASLLRSVPYVLSVLITSSLAGTAVFGLYFLTQVAESKGMETQEVTIFATSVIVAPVPGMLLGSYIVSYFGGYSNHFAAFGLSLIASSLALLASISFPFAETGALLFAASWLYFFAGCTPNPPLHGVSVSAFPRASMVASAVQSCGANLAKLVAPQIGGILCDRLGLLQGFNSTLMVSALLLVGWSWAGVLHTVQRRASTIKMG